MSYKSIEIDDSLRYGAAAGYLDQVKEMLSRGANIHILDDQPLRWSSENGRIEIVKLLLKHGASIDSRNHYAFRMACVNGHLEVAKLLLKAGADAHSSKDYAFRWASQNGHLDVVNLLLKPDISIHTINICLDRIVPTRAPLRNIVKLLRTYAEYLKIAPKQPIHPILYRHSVKNFAIQKILNRQYDS